MKRKSTKALDTPTSRIETFRDPRGYWLDSLTINAEEPSCFNERVSVERWEVTVKKIEEPDEVICARLEKLWRESNNHHDREPLKAMAKKFKYEFTGRFGSERSKS